MPTAQTLCYNCFRQIDSPAAPCPRCGFDLTENRAKFPVALPAGTVLNDRYIVGRVLGQGGFGITYLAFDTQLQAKVAVKEYMPGEMATRTGTTVSVMMDTKAEDFTYGAERFQEEARTLAKFIGHPNIAGVSSYFDENGTSYFVMDYIEGVSFKNYIANNGGKVSVDETLNVMIPVLRALTAVHAEGFIHRDVTLDNVYISKDGNVKLLDFGSARYSIGDKSKSLDVILKVGYAPKEQYIRRGRQGPYTDVYSCAACFYAALTGYLPPESLDRLEEDTLTPVSQVLPDIPEWLDKAVLKGLAVQPEDRFQSAAEFLDAIENRTVVDVPAAAPPAQPIPQKKPKTALIAGIAAVLAVCVGLGALWGVRNREAAPPPAAPEEEPAPQTPEAAPDIQPEPQPPLRQAPVPSITIQGVAYSTDLTELDLTSTPERLTQEDVNALGNMVNLRNLCIIVDPWTGDLSPLANLTGLKYLAVQAMYRDYTEWQDPPETPALTGLEALTELTRLSISGIPLLQEDLETLGRMTSLTDLMFGLAPRTGGVAYDLSPLSSLTELSWLRINGSSSPEERITLVSLEPLRALTGLRELAVNVADLPDLFPLAELTGLRALTLTASEGMDLTPLSGLTELRELWISTHYGAVSMDLSPLRALTKLQTADFFSIHADDWSPVEHVPGLSRENCD